MGENLLPEGAKFAWTFLSPSGSAPVLTPVRVRGGHQGFAWNAQTQAWQLLTPRADRVMVGAAVALLRSASVNDQGGVTTALGQQVTHPSWATSIDVSNARFAKPPSATTSETHVISEAVLLAQPGDHVFGHQLLDLIPRVVTAISAGLKALPFIVRAGATMSLVRLLKSFDITDLTIVELSPNTTTLVDRLYLVTGARENTHLDTDRLEEMRDRWLSRVAFAPGEPAPPSEPVWMSRTQLAPAQRNQRLLSNRDALETAVRQAGYHVAHPQAMSVEDVVALVSQAPLLAGEDGSALHNALALPPTSALLVLGHPLYPDNLHLRLCDALGLRYYFIGGHEHDYERQKHFYPRDRDWWLAPEDLAAVAAIPMG